MIRSREVPEEEWRASLDAIDRRLRRRPEEVAVRLEDGAGGHPIGRRVRLVGVELERKGSGAGAIGLWLDGARGELGHRVARPRRLVIQEDGGGELAAIEIEDASGARTCVYTRAHPSYPEVSAEVPWWRRPLPAAEAPAPR